jgi:hypothetical protein
MLEKRVAARWARETLDDRRGALIDRAVAWPQEPQPDSLSEILGFVKK